MDSEMSRTESKKLDSSGLQNYIGLEGSKWLAENLNEMEHSVKRMLKLIEESNESVHSAELVAGVEESHRIYQSLAQRYNNLTFELVNDLGPDQDGSFVTPNPKLDYNASGRKLATFSNGSGSSDLSPDANNGSSSSSASESESESFYSSFNNYLVSPAKADGQGLKEKEIDCKVGELMEKIIKHEEELRAANLKLQVAEQEVEKLKKELERSGDAVVFAETLCAELEEARLEIKMKDVNVEMEKKRVFELQNQVFGLETRLSDTDSEIRKLMSELGASQKSLETSDDQILSLREALYDCQQNFSMEKSKMQADIDTLLEEQSLQEMQLKELKSMHDFQEAQWEDEIDRLKEDIMAKTEQLETLNKVFDKHKLKFDMLMAEKDDATANVKKITAELRSRDVQISQMEESLNQMRLKHYEIVSESGNAKKCVDELRLTVQELEKEVEKQRVVIYEGEDGKREAIRQLCFSLDHYRSGYRELVRSLSGRKQLPVMAS